MNHLPPLIILLHVSICTSSPRFMLHMSMYSCRCLFMSLLAVANSICVWERNIQLRPTCVRKDKRFRSNHSVGRVETNPFWPRFVRLSSDIPALWSGKETRSRRRDFPDWSPEKEVTQRRISVTLTTERNDLSSDVLNWFLFKVNGVLLNFPFNQKWQQYEAVQPFSTSIIIRNVSWAANQNIRMIMWH